MASRLIPRNLIAIATIAMAGIASADIYRYQDREGRTYLTDKPMHGKRYTLVKKYDFGHARKGWTPTLLKQRKQEFSPLIERIASQNEIHPELVHAIVRAESAYDSDALSPKGAVGLMQLMPATAERYAVTNRNDPEQNLSGGTRYLRDLLNQFDNDLELALAAYNAGENRVIQYGYQVPPFKETQQYVRKVMNWYHSAN
ncbi:MAG: lytic transglycosylase domain-containing protein [bacterium]